MIKYKCPTCGAIEEFDPSWDLNYCLRGPSVICGACGDLIDDFPQDHVLQEELLSSSIYHTGPDSGYAETEGVIGPAGETGPTPGSGAVGETGPYPWPPKESTGAVLNDLQANHGIDLKDVTHVTIEGAHLIAPEKGSAIKIENGQHITFNDIHVQTNVDEGVIIEPGTIMQMNEGSWEAVSPSCPHEGDVYYNREEDNYYCADCHQGMGNAYYKLAKQLEAKQKPKLAPKPKPKLGQRKVQRKVE